MDVFGRHRKSEVAPLLSVAPALPEGRISHSKPLGWSQRDAIPESPDAAPAEPTSPSTRTLNSFARSVISLNRQQHLHSSENDQHEDSDGEGGKATESNTSENQEAPTSPSAVHDPWGNVLGKVMRKTSFHSRLAKTGGVGGSASQISKRVSLTQMLKSREVKDLVKQAIVTNHWTENITRKRSVTMEPMGQRSSVMEHWVKTSMLRNANPLSGSDSADQDDDEYATSGIKSGFDVRDTPTGAMYGRTLLLEESCRRAFAQSGENRSQMDLQALKAWFQMTKLKITTDFERLQPAELDLLCRRMTLVHLHANEVVFRQGDEGDAMYILFAGCVEVKVAQRILGEKVEVTVCELSKGDYFGERALLHDEPRAATIVAKSPCELVRITRKDYNIMLKQDQQEFLSRMQLAGSVNSHTTISTSVKPSLLLPRSRSTLHQQTQTEIINVLSKKKHARSKPDIDMLSEYLQTLKFFRGLPKTFVRELSSVVDFLTLPASSYVFREGEVGDLFYIIFSGSVDVIVSSKDIRGNTQQTKLINLTEGSHFGELALMKGHGIRSATVLTREETKFLVICEKDYNATLRRMQKEDLAKRVAILDRIPMFQTPEWTGELLKEMSYVLSEQKLATGSVLFRQGEKAQQVYFVVRGELLVTKEIVDPSSKEKNNVFVERIGRDRVVGDDAAAGANFNEVIYREVTITAGTPVELLVLSKYDVFHRLSRAARETLRAAAHTHAESVVYLDRYHKTVKWDIFKRKVLSEYLNHERMRKILPTIPTGSKPNKLRCRKRQSLRSVQPVVLDHAPTPSQNNDNEAIVPRHDHEHVEAQSIVLNRSQLVDANEFLLLDPVVAATKKCFPSTERSIAHHVSSFNADAPPRPQFRERILKSAIATEQSLQVEILNEGNPLAYFDLDAVQALQRQQQAEVRGRAASSRRLLLRKRESSNNLNNLPSSLQTVTTTPRDDPRPLSAAEMASRNVMNQFFQENFIFSCPEKPMKGRRTLSKRQNLRNQMDPRHSISGPRERERGPGRRRNAADISAVEYVGQIEAARKAAEQLCHGDFVVVDVSKWDESSDTMPARSSPAFRIRQCCESIDYSSVIPFEPRRLKMLHLAEVEVGADPHDTEIDSNTYVIAKNKFALIPRATRPRVSEEAQQRAVVSRFLRPSALSSIHASTDPMTIFASFQKILAAPAEEQSLFTAQTKTGEFDAVREINGTAKHLRMFASVSIVLSKRELEIAMCDDPFICIHALYPTEAEAMESAMTTPPQALKNALLCILPVGEWVHFDEAYEWCVQVETDRRDKHPPPPSLSGASASLPITTHRRVGSICGIPGAGATPLTGLSAGPAPADWEVEKEKAHRLHQFICTRMGLHAKAHEKHQRSNINPPLISSTGFTPRPTVSLEDKLATLQDYLDTTSQSPLGAKSSTHTSILSKYRQMKRFGSIMRSRISATSTPPLAGAPREIT